MWCMEVSEHGGVRVLRPGLVDADNNEGGWEDED